MSELYSHLHEELEMRLERVGYAFTIPKIVAPNALKKSADKDSNRTTATDA